MSKHAAAALEEQPSHKQQFGSRKNKKRKATFEGAHGEEGQEGPPSAHVHFAEGSAIQQIHIISANPSMSSYSTDYQVSNEADEEEVSANDHQQCTTSASTSSGIGTITPTASAIEEQAHLYKHQMPIVNQHVRVLDAYANAGTILYTKRCRLSDVESSNEQRESIKPSSYQKILHYTVASENLIVDGQGKRFQLVVLTAVEVIIYKELEHRLHNAEPQSIITLHNFMLKNIDLPEVRCCYYFTQMVQIVAFMHEKGAVLRDISLRRWVFIDKEKLTLALGTFVDMQLLATRNIDADDTLTERFGCAAYMSPEMLSRSSGTWSGRAADVWALGVCLFVFLTKRFPYYHITAQGLFRKIRQADLVFPAEAPVSPKAQDLIQKLLHRDPKRRPRANEILGHPWFREIMPDYPIDTVEIEEECPASYTSVGMPSFDHVDFAAMRIADDDEIEEDSRTTEDSDKTIKATENPPLHSQSEKMEH